MRRYGFHGTSHRYVAYRWRKLTGRAREDTKLITLHLGNGCSACAIEGGESIDTSMGLTPLEGLVMGTRSGDVDPSVLEFLHHKEGLGIGRARRHAQQAVGAPRRVGAHERHARPAVRGDASTATGARTLAIDLFCARVKKYVGAYLARMNGAEAIVFTGGIGENAAAIRAAHLRRHGRARHRARSREERARRSTARRATSPPADSRVRVWVIPTNEELLIARDTVRVVQGIERRY